MPSRIQTKISKIITMQPDILEHEDTFLSDYKRGVDLNSRKVTFISAKVTSDSLNKGFDLLDETLRRALQIGIQPGDFGKQYIPTHLGGDGYVRNVFPLNKDVDITAWDANQDLVYNHVKQGNNCHALMQFAVKLAQSVAIIGIILSCLSIILSIFSWNYFPMTIAVLFAFILVLIGLKKTRPGYLLAANVILAMAVIIDSLFLIGSLYIGIVEPREFIEDFHQSQVYSNWSDAKRELRIAYFVLAFILMIVIGLLLFAFIVFHKARKYLSENPRRCSLFPDTFIGRRPVHHYGFYSNSPMCSRNYNSTQQMPTPVYSVENSQPFYSSENGIRPSTLGAGVVLEVKPPKY